MPVVPFSAAWSTFGVQASALVATALFTVVLFMIGLPWWMVLPLSVVCSYAPTMLWVQRVCAPLGRLREVVGLRWSWGAVLLGVPIWLSTNVAVGIFGQVLDRVGVPFSSNVPPDSEGLPAPLIVWMLVAAVIVAPVVEEIAFRGIVLRGLLSRWSPPVAILMQGFLFAVLHAAPWYGAGNLGLVAVLWATGSLWGVWAWWRQSVVPTIVAHMLMNAAALAFALLL